MNEKLKVGQIYEYPLWKPKGQTIGIRIVSVVDKADGSYVAKWSGIKADWHGSFETSSHCPLADIPRDWKLIEDVP